MRSSGWRAAVGHLATGMGVLPKDAYNRCSKVTAQTGCAHEIVVSAEKQTPRHEAVRVGARTKLAGLEMFHRQAVLPATWPRSFATRED